MIMAAFDPNQKDFPSFAHRCLWCNGLMLMPPEISLANLHDERRTAFTDLYRYMTDMYKDMYDHPDSYFIDYNGIQEAMNGRRWGQAVISSRFHHQKERESKLWELERTLLPRMIVEFLFRHLERDKTSYFVEQLVFQKAFFKKINGKCRYKIREEAFLELLQRCGLQVTRGTDRVFFRNDRYPQMFAAIDEWKKLMAPYRKGSVKYKYDAAFQHLDYRIFLPDYQITFESSQWFMSDDVVAFLTEIADMLAGWGLKLKKADSTSSIAIGCNYKGEHLVWFNQIPNFWNTYPQVRINLFRCGSPELADFEEEIRQLPNAEEVRTFCLKGLNRCRKCGCHPVPPSQLGCWAEILGQRVNLCGGGRYIETRQFDQKSLEIMKTLLSINYRIIQKHSKK